MALTKTDNRSLPSKLAIRRWLLDRMALGPLRVLDACHGAGHVWHAMEDFYPIERLTKVDVKPRPGTGAVLKMTATEAMEQLPLEEFNVIDIDPYGEPWEAYEILLKRFRQPVGVFLTQGRVMQSRTAKSTRTQVGIPLDWPIPNQPAFNEFVSDVCLSRTWLRADIKLSAVIRLAHVSYHALSLAPKRADGASK